MVAWISTSPCLTMLPTSTRSIRHAIFVTHGPLPRVLLAHIRFLRNVQQYGRRGLTKLLK